MELVVLTIVALLAGFCQPIQSGTNARLSQTSNSSFFSGAISNFVGAIVMFIIAFFFSKELPSLPKFSENPWWMWTGGLFSVVIIVSMIVLPSKMSYMTFFSTFITGQIVMAMLIDRFALFGGHVVAISPGRIIGLICLVVGVYLSGK